MPRTVWKKNIINAINRSYYAVFYAIKSVLALEGKDFKRHKDVIVYFNKTYVASGIIAREMGRKIGRLQQKREKSDYDDFYIASREETTEQIENAKEIIVVIREYLEKEGWYKDSADEAFTTLMKYSRTLSEDFDYKAELRELYDAQIALDEGEIREMSLS